jgi:hypothetical protein
VTDTIRSIPFLNSQRYRYRRKFTEIACRLCTVLARWNLPGLTAFVIARLMIPLQKARPGQSGTRTIVVLVKAGLTEDIIASIGDEPAFGVIAMDRTITKAVAAAYIPNIRDDNSYLSNVEADAPAKTALRRFWQAVLRRLVKFHRIDGIITGNFSYHAEQELAGAATELGVPFVALQKECRKTPRLADFYEDVYRTRKGAFRGSNVLSYNQIEADIQTAAGVTPAGIIEITGMPRMDAVHQRRRLVAGNWSDRTTGRRPTILFFSVFEKYGLPFIRRFVDGKRYDEPMPAELESLNWSSLISTLHHSMIDLARAHPEVDVVIKTKGDPVAAETLRQMFGEVLQLPANMRLVSGGDPLDLIFACDVVCGFNTTALVEAIAADVPVVVPHFAEAVAPGMAGYVMDLGNAVIRASSREYMIESLVDLARRGIGKPVRDLRPEQTQALVHWVGNADGEAGTRVRDALLKITAPVA